MWQVLLLLIKGELWLRSVKAMGILINNTIHNSNLSFLLNNVLHLKYSDHIFEFTSQSF